VAGGDATISNWELVYRHQIQLIGLNIGMLIRAAPQVFGELMGAIHALIAVGVLTPGQPTSYDLADGAKALTELETRATVGKLALLPDQRAQAARRSPGGLCPPAGAARICA
jgi:NADPH2:quinone reductase